jgi:HK97 family phage major capsid protein
MTLRELKERYSAKAKAMRDLHDGAEKEDRGFTDEEKQKWEALRDEVDDLKERIETREELEADYAAQAFDDEQREEEERETRDTRRSLGQEDRPLTRAEQRTAFRAWANPADATADEQRLAARAGLSGNRLELNFRWEGRPPRTIEEVDKLYRAQSLTAAEGGYTVPDEMMRAIETSLLTFGNVRGAATVIPTTTGADLPIPTCNDTGNVGAILAENTQVAAQDLTFAQLVLNAFKYSSKLVLVSVELMQDSSVNLPQYLGERLGERIARITNQHFTTGDASSKPNGIVTAAGDSSVTTASNTAVTFSEMMSLKHAVDPGYRVGASWMMDDAIVKILKTQLDSTNRPIWQPSIIPGAPSVYDGDPVIVNNDMATGSAAKAIIYGNLKKYLVREVRGVTLLRLDERYADYHQVGFLAFARYDGDLLDAGTDPVKYATLAT